MVYQNSFVKKIKQSIFLFLISFISIYCNNEPAPVDCEYEKRQFINYVEDNIDEIIPVMIREMKRPEGDNSMSSQRVIDAIQSITFLSQWNDYESKLKNNCPDAYEQFEKEIGLILLTEIMKNPEIIPE